jgi:hypothetical protein
VVNTRPKHKSQSDDRIFEHPEVTIKPSTIDDRMQRRAIMMISPLNTNENGGGSVPNILEHPDMSGPVVMQPQQTSSSSSSTRSSTSIDKRHLFRQQSGKFITILRTKTISFLFSRCLLDIGSYGTAVESSRNLGRFASRWLR